MLRMMRKLSLAGLIVLFFLVAGAGILAAQNIPGVSIQIGGGNNSPDNLAITVQIVLLLTLLTVAPALLILLTSFTRIVIVLSLLRHALSTQQIPPNQVIIGLSLFLTFFIMSPVIDQINTDAVKPYMAKQISQREAFDRGIIPLRAFMFKQTREKDIALFMKAARLPAPANEAAVPTRALIPAFIISELRTAFEMGFMLFVPFLVIDMVVASVLMSMGMLMLPPIMISLPFKILLFVLVDGWNLLIQSLIMSFR
jgi:flagellar biosynthesis protein FliP